MRRRDEFSVNRLVALFGRPHPKPFVDTQQFTLLRACAAPLASDHLATQPMRIFH